MTWKQWTVFVCLAVIWGSSWLAAGTLADQVPPLAAGAARFLVAALLLLPLILIKRLKIPRGRELGSMAILSVTLIVLPFVTLVWTAQRVSSATTTLLFAATPLIVALRMSALQSRPVPRVALQAMLAGLGGVALGIWGATSLAFLPGCAALLLVVTCAAFSLVYAKTAMQNVNPLVSASLQLGCAAIILAIGSLLTERDQAVPWSRSAVESLLYLGALSGAVGFSTYFWLLKQLTPYQLASIQWMEALVAIVESAVLFRQALSWGVIAGALITLASLVFVMRAQSGEDDPLSLQVTD